MNDKKPDPLRETLKDLIREVMREKEFTTAAFALTPGQIRASANMSVEDLAKASGVSVGPIQRYERGAVDRVWCDSVGRHISALVSVLKCAAVDYARAIEARKVSKA